LAESDRPTSGSSVNRRAFFRQIFTRGVEKVEEAGRAFAQRIQEAMPPEARSTPSPAPLPGDYPLPVRYLRPPGALPESLMATVCSRCGDCVRACPANCIKIDPEGKTALGLPYIIARESPCVVCSDLACMKACPTGALVPVERIEQINMGTAALNDMSCVRGPYGDQEDCRLCITHCPVGQTAIQLDPHHNIVQILEGCIGCGVCEKVCPTAPPSIWVEPSMGF